MQTRLPILALHMSTAYTKIANKLLKKSLISKEAALNAVKAWECALKHNPSKRLCIDKCERGDFAVTS